MSMLLLVVEFLNVSLLRYPVLDKNGIKIVMNIFQIDLEFLKQEEKFLERKLEKLISSYANFSQHIRCEKHFSINNLQIPETYAQTISNNSKIKSSKVSE